MKTIVQLVLIDETGDSYYRMRWPGRALAEQDSDICLINLDARATERIELAKKADLLVLFQSNDLDLIEIIDDRRKAGKKTLVEYNDNFYAPPPCSPVFGPWSNPNTWQTYETIMNRGDHLIVTGEGLKSLLKDKTNTEISILENHIYDFEKNFDDCWNKSNDFRIGWAGSVGHMSDLLSILPVLEDFCSKHENAKLYLMGNESIPSYVTLPNSKFSFKPWGAMSDYYDFLKEIHVGIAPLANSPYNNCRSDIKAIEYASRAVAPIVQNLTPYKKLIDKNLVKSFSNFSEIYSTLENLYNNRNDLVEYSRNCFQYVLDKRLAIKNKERLELYQKFITTNSKKGFVYKSGYHEVMGTSNSELNCMKIANQTQELIKNKDLKAAISLVKKHKKILAFEPTLNLLLAEATKFSDIEEAEEMLADASVRFPLDLRFKLQAIKLKSTTSEKIGRWMNLIDILERQDVFYSNFYEAAVCNLFLADLTKYPELLDAGISLANIYDKNFELSFRIADACIKAQRFKECKRLGMKAYDIFQINTKKKNTTQLEKDTEQYLLTIMESADYSIRMQ